MGYDYRVDLTKEQEELVHMRDELGMSWPDISRQTDRDRANIQRSYKAAKKKLAAKGIAPESGMNVPIAEGFALKGYSHYDANTQTWYKAFADTEGQAVEAIEQACQSIKPLARVKSPRKVRSDLLNMIHVTDYHLGMYAYGPETGDDWDMKIARREFGRVIGLLVDGAPAAEVGVFSQGGDFLHYDSLEAVTPTNKHVLDADTRASQMVEVALDLHCFAIDEMLKKHRRVIAVIQEGNHDLMSSIWLRKAMKQYFSKNPRVEILDTEFPFYAYLHGQIMLAWHHGHKVKNKSLPSLFASEPRYREMWGKAKYTYIHTGHYHQTEQDQAEHGGAIVERHPTLASRDAHAARGGYVSWRGLRRITYHKTAGEVSRQTEIPGAYDE
jgi:hypothetical protein